MRSRCQDSYLQRLNKQLITQGQAFLLDERSWQIQKESKNNQLLTQCQAFPLDERSCFILFRDVRSGVQRAVLPLRSDDKMNAKTMTVQTSSCVGNSRNSS